MLLGDKSAVKGGSGKVVNSGPNDRIFLYYSDHGGPGVLGESVIILDLQLLTMEYILILGVYLCFRNAQHALPLWQRFN